MGSKTMQRISIREMQEWSPMDGSGLDLHRPLRKSISYVSNFRHDIGVSTRDGFRWRLSPQPDRTKSVPKIDTLIVIVEVYVPLSMVNDFLRTSMPKHDDDGVEFKLAEKQLVRDSSNAVNPSRSCFIRYYRTITKESLDKAGGSIYLHEEDVVFTCMDSRDDIALHPESHEGRLIRHRRSDLNKSSEYSEGSNFIYTIKIIDRCGVIGPRWIRMNRSIFRIDPITESDKPDGVYIMAPKGHDSATQVHASVIDHLQTEDEFEKVGLFRTYKEAVNSDSEYLIKLNEIDARLRVSENSLERANSDKDRLAHELEMASLKAAQDKVKHEQDIEKLRAELDLLKQKQQYEKSSSFRKNLLDFLKSVPALLTAGIAAFMAIRKYFFAAPT